MHTSHIRFFDFILFFKIKINLGRTKFGNWKREGIGLLFFFWRGFPNNSLKGLYGMDAGYSLLPSLMFH